MLEFSQDEVEQIARTFFGDPNKALSTKTQLPFGTHGSKAVDLFNGKWFDFETQNGGDMFALVKREKGLTDKQTFEWLLSNNIKPINVNGAANSANDAKLPEIMKSIERGEIIFITEGEKCADSLWALGLPATCNAMGAGKWPDKLTPHFKGADVVILPDDDVPGKNHAIFVAEKLRGTAKRVRIIELPGLAPKGDVFDWLEAGGTAEQLHEIIDKNINIDDVIKSPEAFGKPPPDGPCRFSRRRPMASHIPWIPLARHCRAPQMPLRPRYKLLTLRRHNPF